MKKGKNIYILVIVFFIALISIWFRYTKTLNKTYIDKIQQITIAQIIDLDTPASSIDLDGSQVNVIKRVMNSVVYKYTIGGKTKCKVPYIVGTVRMSNSEWFRFKITNEGIMYVIIPKKGFFLSSDIYYGKLSEEHMQVLKQLCVKA